MRGRLVLGAVAVVAVGGALAAIPALRGLIGGPEVPVLEVRKGPFVRRVLAEGNLSAVKATPVTAPMESDEPMKIAWLIPDGTRVKAGDVVVRFDPTEMEKKLVDGESDQATAQSRIDAATAQSRGAVENLKRDADMARLEMEYAGQFQGKDPEIFSRAEIIRSEIDTDLARRRLDNAESVRGIRERLTGVDLDLLAIERKKAELRIGQAKKALNALEIRAPHDGVLVFKRNWRGMTSKIGDTVWAGFPLAEIPEVAEMQAETYVLEADAGGLAPGLSAEVVLEADPDVVYPAKVKKVDALAKRRVGWIPVQYFGVTLALERTDPETMKPGQRVQATLFLDERKEALTVPRNAVFEKDGKKIVYLRKGFGFQPVEIDLGPSAVGKVVVEKGLADGDVVALKDPTKKEEDTVTGEAGGDRPQAPSGPVAGGAR